MEGSYPYNKISKYCALQQGYTYLEENYLLKNFSERESPIIKNIIYIKEIDGPESLQQLKFYFADGCDGLIERFGNRIKVIPDDETYNPGFSLRDKIFSLSESQRVAIRKMLSRSAKTLLDDTLEYF